MFVLFSGSIRAQEKPAIRMKMELMSIRNRSSGPLPVHIKLEYNKPQILEGDLELEIYDAVDVVSSDDLMASLRYEGIVLAGADYEFNIVLPPLKTSITQNWAVVASFVTDQGRIKLSSVPDKLNIIEPFDLLTTSPMERGVLLCSCFKETRRHSESANRKFLESALSLDNYNPLYAELEAEQTNAGTQRLSGEQQIEKMGRTFIHFAGQWSSKDLPQDPLSYCAFDVVLLSDESLAALQKEQLDGLTAWVRAGGSVCIVPDIPMKPLQLEFLRKLFEQGADSSANLSLDAEGRLLVVSDEPDPIIMSHCGLGRAVLLPVSNDFSASLTKEDLGAIVAFLWKVRKDQTVWQGKNWNAANVWQILESLGVEVEQDEDGVYVRGEQYQYQGFREKDGKYYFEMSQLFRFGVNRQNERLSPQAEPLLAVAEQALMPADVEMVPTWIIGMILMGYVAAIGPGDYFLLGWLRLRKYTWVLFPVITGVFTLLTVMVANAFMGSEDTGGKLVITDLADNGIPVRQTTLETLYYSAQANVRNFHKGELVVLSEDNFTNAEYYNQYGQQQQRTQDSPLSYSGHFPQSYSVSHRVQQWSPVSLRTLSLEPQESEVPPIDWNDVSLLTTPEGNTRLKAALTQHMISEQKSFVTPAQCFAVIYHESTALNLMGFIPQRNLQKDRFGRYMDPGNYQIAQQSASLTMLGNLPTVKTAQTNIFGLVSQIAPHGAGSLEDLALLDSSDPSQWALVIIKQQGEDFEVFRKLYFVQP